jgi:hypothetical protein
MGYKFWPTAGKWLEMTKIDSVVVISVRSTHYSMKIQYMCTICSGWNKTAREIASSFDRLHDSRPLAQPVHERDNACRGPGYIASKTC